MGLTVRANRRRKPDSADGAGIEVLVARKARNWRETDSSRPADQSFST
jgi:hypothetical protein